LVVNISVLGVGVEKVSVLIVAHGSRDQAANQEFEHLVEQYCLQHPQWEIAHAYLELAKPLLGEALEKMASSSDHIILLPLLLFAGRHVRHDIPEAVQRVKSRFPTVRVEIASTLGTDPALLKVIDERINEAIKPQKVAKP
jgi:sirohydrochlorin cobaltochelatase